MISCNMISRGYQIKLVEIWFKIKKKKKKKVGISPNNVMLRLCCRTL